MMFTNQKERLDYFYKIVAEDDVEAIESARDVVAKEDILILMNHYNSRTGWNEKRALVDLIQDQYVEGIATVMLDYLRAPYEDDRYLDMIECSKAVALSFQGEDYDQFMKYYNDRTLLHADIAKVLVANNLTLDQEKPNQSTGADVAELVDDASDRNEVESVTSRYSETESLFQNLWKGIEQADYSRVNESINRGVDVNACIVEGNYSGCSVLIFAVLKEAYAIAKLLIENGADVNYRRRNKHNLEAKNGQTALWWAANHNNAAFIRYLISLGADVDAEDWHQSTPLTAAASTGAAEAVKALLEHGANIHAKISDGRKAINLADSVKVVELLIDAGENPDCLSSSGYTPLMSASEAGNRPLISLLLAKRADVNAKHTGAGIYCWYKGMTPLAFSIHRGFVKASELLIKGGAEVNYIVPPRVSWQGESLPAQSIIKFANGQRAESVRNLLLKNGAKE